MKDTNPYNVKVGQVWRSMDYRDVNSYKRVLSIDDDLKATVIACSANGSYTFHPRSHIRLDRFKPTSNGYELVQDVPTWRWL